MKDKFKLILTMILLSVCISSFTIIYVFQMKEMSSHNLAQNISKFKNNTSLDETDLKIKINIDYLDNIIGKKIKIESKSYTKEATIESDTTIFKNTPVGKYTIILPSSKENIYNYPKENKFDLTLNKNTVSYDYEKDDSSLAHDEIINFQNDDGVYASVFFNGNNIIIKKSALALASSFVKIYDEKDNLIEEIDFMDEALGETFEKKVPYNKGYKISLYHVGGNRGLSITSGLFSTLEIKTGINNFFIGDYGLYQEGLDEYQGYLNKLDNYALAIKNNTSSDIYNNKEEFEKAKRIFYLSILSLNEEAKQIYLNKYNILFKGSKPSLKESEVTISKPEDLYTKLKGIDLEDGTFAINANNFCLLNDLSTLAIGENDVLYVLTDTDGNKYTSSLKIYLTKTIEETTKPENEKGKENEEKKETPVLFEYQGDVIVVETSNEANSIA